MSFFKLGLRIIIITSFILFIVIIAQFANSRSITRINQVNAQVTTFEGSVSKKNDIKSPIVTTTQTPPITPTITLTIVPTSIPIEITPTNTPTALPPPISSGNGSVDSINEYRSSKGLTTITTDGNTCGFAATRASEISSDFSHNGFISRRDSGSLPYPGYSNVVENIAMTGNGNAVEMWKGSPSHDANLQANITYGCVANSGSYFVFEGWKP